MNSQLNIVKVGNNYQPRFYAITPLRLYALEPILSVFFKDQPVRRAYLFGSFVRGENNSESDLDILVELEPGTGLFKFISIQHQLQIALKMHIDLVSANGLSPGIKPYIDSEKILVYEK